jgi:leucyl aminopeptidase (aminopeptidase T)
MPMPVRSLPKLLAVTLVLATATGTPRALAAGKPDLKSVAERIVAECAGVHEGDMVLIVGDVLDIDLVDDLGVATARHGGAPVQLVGRGKAGVRYYTEVPEKYDGTRAGFAIKLAAIPTVVLQIDRGGEPGLYKAIPASRLATVAKSFRPVGEAFMRPGVRQVYIGNGLYPSPANARVMGVGQAELEKIFWGALATDPRLIQANGARVKGAFAGARQVRVTHPNGTDLQFGVEGRPVILSDGVITPEQAAKGGASAILYLPAGEAQLAPVSGTAEGKIVFDRMDTGVGRIEKLTWTFRAGKLASYTAKPGPAFDRWKEIYEAAPSGKDAFAGIDLGLHPGVKSPAQKPLLSFIPAGMVSLFLGDDTGAGGTNATSYGSTGFLPGATVEVDGKPVVEKGVLKAAAK